MKAKLFTRPAQTVASNNAGPNFPLPAVYTVSLCRKDDTLYGPVHWSADAITTFCGRGIDAAWFIINNTFEGVATCRKCIGATLKLSR